MRMKKITLFMVLMAAVLFAIPTHAFQGNQGGHMIPAFLGQKTKLMGTKGTNSSVRHKIAFNNDIIEEIPETAEVMYYTRSGYYHDSNNGYQATEQSGTAIIAFNGNDVYLQSPVAGYSSGTWVKGTKDGNTITFPLKQFLFYNTDAGYGLYITMADIDESANNDLDAESITYTISEDGKTITQNGTTATRTLAVAWSDDDTVYSYGAPGGEYGTVFTWDSEYVPTPTVLVELPDGAEVETWYASGSGSAVPPSEVKVAFAGSDVFVGGLFSSFPTSWIKGTIDGNKVTFESLQYIGDYGEYNIWVIGADSEGNLTQSFTMTYDADANTLTLDQGQYLLANASDIQMYYLSFYTELTIKKESPAPVIVDALPYSNSFDTAEQLSDFRIIDANKDGSTWGYSAVTGGYMAVYTYNSDNTADDWFVSPQLPLQAGKKYHVAFAAHAYKSSYPEKFEVKAAKEATAADANTVALLEAGIEVMPAETVTSSAFKTYENLAFTVAEDGLYNIGIHAISDPDQAYLYVDDFVVEEMFDIALNEEDDNTALLAEYNGKTVNATITRTLKAGSWNTIALPFAVSSSDINALGLTVRQLRSTDLTDGVLTLTFANARSMTAGKPYLVKPAEDINLAAIEFDGVAISNEAKPTTTTNVDFIPTFGKTTISGDYAKSVIFLGAENKLYSPSELPADIKGFRAYFQLKDEAAEAPSIKLDFGDEEVTGIKSIENLTTGESQVKGIFTLDGRRINEPAQKGVYIINGKKVIK